MLEKRVIWNNRLSLRQISKNLKKSPTILIVISYNPKPVKMSYANGRVSVRIFYKNNLINASSKSESRFIKLVREKIHHSLLALSTLSSIYPHHHRPYSTRIAAIATVISSSSLPSSSSSLPSFLGELNHLSAKKKTVFFVNAPVNKHLLIRADHRH